MSVSGKPMRHAFHAGSRHVAYEIQMLIQMAANLQTTESDDFTRNARLESFAIHARSLLDFFGDAGRSDDMLAVHYVKDWSHMKFALQSLDSVRKRVGKEIAT